MDEFARTSVITIQGGGAIAIDLIGQLQGLTGLQTDGGGRATGDHGLLPVAVAGTSAGAIIATLYWAGYAPEDIRTEVVQLFARERLNRFFGRGWMGLSFLGFSALSDCFAAFKVGWGTGLRYIFWPGSRRWYLVPVWPLFQVVRLPSILLVALCGLLCRRGLFTGEGMVKAIDQLLRNSPLLREHTNIPSAGELCFGDVTQLNDPRTMPLFLIVTHVDKAEMLVISSIDPAFARFEIARCARASGGFPGFFQPIALQNCSTCVDGGVISNFPAWVFGFNYRDLLKKTGQKQFTDLAYWPWLHVGLRLPSDPPINPGKFMGFVAALWTLLSSKARAILDQKLSTVVRKRRVVCPTVPPPGDGPRNVLDFDALSDAGKVKKAYDRGRKDGQNAIEPDCFALPLQSALKPILLELAEHGRLVLEDWLVPGTPVRANIFLPQGDELALLYQANMDADPDRQIRFRHDQGISSLVYSTRAAVVADLRGRTHSNPAASGNIDPYLTATGAPAIRADRTWLLSIPLLDMAEAQPVMPPSDPLAADMDGPVLGVLNVDAAIDYTKPGAPSPDVAREHPAVTALFNLMQSAAGRCSVILNQKFWSPQ